MLAHAGTGRLVFVDPDTLEDVNLSRTHGTSPATVGQLKVQSAKAMVERISPETRSLLLQRRFRPRPCYTSSATLMS
jgi:molybdopterin/thiamine biosynthesis adenylyltransferase